MLCSVQGKTLAFIYTIPLAIMLSMVGLWVMYHLPLWGHTHKRFGTAAVNSHFTEWIVIFQA